MDSYPLDEDEKLVSSQVLFKVHNYECRINNFWNIAMNRSQKITDLKIGILSQPIIWYGKKWYEKKTFVLL